MPKYQKRSIVVDAVRVADLLAARERNRTAGLPEWLIDAYWAGSIVIGDLPATTVKVFTEGHGWTTAKEGDWLIRGVKGEIYPCEPDIFDATYEPVIECRDVSGNEITGP
jgi:hypothetical protein